MQPGFDALPLRKDFLKHFRRALGSLPFGESLLRLSNAAALRTQSGLAGTLIDRAYAEYLTNADITTTTPVDDTIPQITEGVQIISLSYTPKSATNRLRLRFQCECCVAVLGGTIVGALHTSASANALASSLMNPGQAGYGTPFGLEKEFVPGSTSTITLSVRVGVSAGASFRLNGNTGTRYLGGSMGATFVIEELSA